MEGSTTDLANRDGGEGDDWYQFGTIGRMAMTLRTDAELDAALNALAESEGLSKQDVVRRAVLELHHRKGHRAKVDGVADQVMIDYAEALERLGSV